MMIKIPDVTIGEHRKASKEFIELYTRKYGAQLTDEFSMFRIDTVSFNWDEKKFVVHIRSVVNPNHSAGVDADVIETCKVVK